MQSDHRLLVLIFAVLVALIALPLAIEHVRTSRRPVMTEARIVSATASDPVFRSGPRHVAPGESVDAAVAVRISRSGLDAGWLAPVPRLDIDGVEVEHLQSDRWIEDDLTLRVFWFSVESANLGGRLTADTAADRLRYRSFLAPEMGRGLLANRLPETHNDDHLGGEGSANYDMAGTFRLYARVEIVEKLKDIQPVQIVVTLGPDRLDDPLFPSLFLSADFGGRIDQTVGELFRLPGFEPTDDQAEDWNRITDVAFGCSFTDLVAMRLTTSSWTFAAVATAGRPELESDDLEALGRLSVADDALRREGRSLEWDADIMTGDLLRSGERWIVLLADDGNGLLDPRDSVVYSWGRPPARTTLFAALDPGSTTAELMRHVN